MKKREALKFTVRELKTLRFACEITIDSEYDFIECHKKFGKVMPEYRKLVQKTKGTISRLERLLGRINENIER